MKNPQDQFIKIDEYQTRYWVEGESKVPIILLHGLGGVIENWILLMNSINNSHKIYAMDLPGHGRTELHQNKYEILDFVHFIREFMDTLKIERAHLIGHSLGGAIAARFALTYPEKVEKLILVSSAGLGRELGFGLRLMTINGLGEMITRPKFNNMKNSLKLLVYDKKVITNEIVEMMCETSYLPGTQSSYLKILRRNATILGQRKSQYEPILQGLSQFKNSVLLIWGRQDGFVPIWHAYRAAKILQNSQIIIFENCGHLPMYEHTTNFNSAVADFLKVE